MADDNKISKEEKWNQTMLDIRYRQTKYCPICHIKLAIDGSCDSPICC